MNLTVEKWTREIPAALHKPPAKAHRTIKFDDRDNVTMTRAEAEGLLKLAGYKKGTTND